MFKEGGKYLQVSHYLRIHCLLSSNTSKHRYEFALSTGFKFNGKSFTYMCMYYAS